MKEAIFAVKLETALKVRPFISKDATRYYLGGVYVQALNGGGATCTATDGHRLGIARDADGFCTQSVIAIIPDYVKQPPRLVETAWLVGIQTSPRQGCIAVYLADRALSAKDVAIQAVSRPDKCEVMAGNAFIDGTFPDISRAVPALKDDAASIAFNPSLLRGFGRQVTLTGNGAVQPHVVKGDDPDFFGVIMPMRGVPAGVPNWFEPAKAAAAEAKKAA